MRDSFESLMTRAKFLEPPPAALTQNLQHLYHTEIQTQKSVRADETQYGGAGFGQIIPKSVCLVHIPVPFRAG